MLSMYEAPAPFWMACCGLCCPYPAAASFDRSAESGLSGAWSSSRSIIVMIISTWASSSVPIARSMSLYLPGSRQFQPCSRYCVATVISPHWPPRTSCILRAKSGSGPSGLASYCRAWVWVNTGSPRVVGAPQPRDTCHLPAPGGLPVPSRGPHVPCWNGPAAGARRERASGGGQRGPFSAVGELDDQRQRGAVVLPDDPAAELAGLPLHRPQTQPGQVDRRPDGAQVAGHPVGGQAGLGERDVHPAAPAGDHQPHP